MFVWHQYCFVLALVLYLIVMDINCTSFKILIMLFSLPICLFYQMAHATDVRYCNEKVDYNVKVKGVEISPNPIVRGQPATFSISAIADKEISKGEFVIDVSYFGWHIHSETHDLCQQTSCPVSTGHFMVSHTQVLPGFTPPGSYSLKMKMFDGKKHELTCIEFGFNIGFISTVVDI